VRRLLLDAGQTGIRARVAEEGVVIDTTLGPLRTSESIPEQIVNAVGSVLEGSPVDTTVSCAISGLTDPERLARHVVARSSGLGVVRVLVAHDSVTSYLACVGRDHGAVIAAGTGVVTLAVGPTGQARIDGWGNIMGDSGSGYWIGQAGLEAAMRAHDGRGPHTSLLDALRRDFPDPELAYVSFQSDPNRIARVASFAHNVLDSIQQDAVAARIARAAASELALSVTTGLKRTGWSPQDSPVISWSGGVMKNPFIREQLEVALRQAWPAAAVVAPRGDPLDGVALLGVIPADHPLSSSITASGNRRSTPIEGR